MVDRHVGLIVEDNPEAARALREMVLAMDHVPVVVTTLEEARAWLAENVPCYVLQDIQVPAIAGERPHERAGKSSIAIVRKLSNGPARVVVIVVTEFRNDPDFVWSIRDLEVDGFVEKSRLEVLPERVLAQLAAKGRADHAACAACNAKSRPADTPPVVESPVARLFSHEKRGAPALAAELAEIVHRRAELDLFLDFARAEPRGHAAGHKDLRGVFRETFLNATQAAIIAELVEKRGQAVRGSMLACLKERGLASGVRLAQQARKLVDVPAVVDGKVLRNRWRAFHTTGDKHAPSFRFDPPPGFKWAVLLPPA